MSVPPARSSMLVTAPGDQRAATSASFASAGVGDFLIRLDHLVDIREGHGLAFQDMRPVAGLAQIENGPARDDLAAVRQESFQHLLEVHQLAAGHRAARPC